MSLLQRHWNTHVLCAVRFLPKSSLSSSRKKRSQSKCGFPFPLLSFQNPYFEQNVSGKEVTSESPFATRNR